MYLLPMYVLDLLFQKKNGRRAYKCQLCPTINNGTKEIKHHIAVVHEGKKPYACEICHKEFGYFQSMKKHQEGKCSEKTKKLITDDNKKIVGYNKFTVLKLHMHKF